jgi:REP element-mobilizing transposase RayT
LPRPGRVFIPGGIYHVYARIARGEAVLAKESEAAAFLAIVREAKQRDGFRLLAWCVMSNHYHLALRTGQAPLWRTMASIQGRYSRRFNRSRRVLGPLWQGRYRAKLIESEGSLERLIAYIHLNPVVAGLVEDPAHHMWSGHNELLGRVRDPLADVDDTLSIYGDTRRAARRVYARSLRGERDQEWIGEAPGRLPWWSGTGERDHEIDPWYGGPFVDYLGRSSEPAAPAMSAELYLGAACRALGVELSELAGRGKSPELGAQRGLLVLLGVERFGQKISSLAAVLSKHPGSLSFAARRCAARRCEDAEVRALCDRIGAAIAGGRASRADRRR